MEKIALLFAMQTEADPVLKALQLTERPAEGSLKGLPFKHYTGVHKGKLEVIVAVNGMDPRYNVDNIGTEPAAVNAMLTVTEMHPDCIVSVGTAGSFAGKGAAIGDVYLSDSQFSYHDHRIPLPGWDKFGLGRYASVNVGPVATALGLKRANISTGNSLDFTDADLKALKVNNAILKEMEAAAIAWVCFITKTPFFALKSVTNLIAPGIRSEEEFQKNLLFATRSLGTVTLRMLDYLAEHGLRGLV